MIKRIKNGGVAIKTEQYYRNDDPTKSYETLLKKGRKIDGIVIPEVAHKQKLKGKKLKA